MTGNTNTATDFRNTILNGDSVELMRTMPRNSVEFILIDPPVCSTKWNHTGGSRLFADTRPTLNKAR